MKKLLTVLWISATFISCEVASQKAEEKPLKTVVIIVDALRFDYVNENITPNIHALIEKGSFGLHHHSTFPTVTRVNSTSYATGAYPKTHGILGNNIYLPSVDPSRGLNTGDAEVMIKADAAENGKLLTSLSIGEVMDKNNLGTYAVFSTGSTGQSFLLNHKVKGMGIINPEMILPSNLEKKVIEEIGKIPPKSKPNKERHKWITDAYIRYALNEDIIDVATIWYSDPDATAHGAGIGAPLTLESIKNVDEQIGRIFQAIESMGLNDRVNVIISADHGFATHKGNPGISNFLIEKGFKENKESSDIVVVGNAVYLAEDQKVNSSEVINALMREEWVGGIFVNPELDLIESISGNVFSFEDIHWNHLKRRSDIYVDVNWTDEENEFGYQGFSYNNGVAGHGSASPYEMKTPFVAVGPSFKTGFKNEFPSAMVDLVPTVLHIHGLDDSEFVPDGRVLKELLSSDTDEANTSWQKDHITKKMESNDLQYEMEVHTSTIGDFVYLDYTKVKRLKK